MSKRLFYYVYIIFACALLAIGRLSDDRLVLENINISHIISCIYIIMSFVIIISFRSIYIDVNKRLLLLFYSSILLTAPALWLIFGIFEPTVGTFDGGLLNYMNFFLIIVPTSFIIMERFDYKYVKFMIIVLLGVSLLLAFTSIFGITEREDGRLGVLGGGPIVFCRWMQYGVLVLLLYPNKKWMLIRIIAVLGLLVLSFATGSRGPLLALFLTGLIYIFLNFRKSFLRFFSLVILLFLLFVTTNIEKEVNKLGNTKRVFMNFSLKGFNNHSTGTRMDMINRSFDIINNYPFGVGAGNWQYIANKINNRHLMKAQNFYPHNLFLEIACEYGIHTLLLLILVVLYSSFLAYKKMIKYKDNDSSIYPLLYYLFLFLFFNSLMSGMLNDSRLLIVIISFILIRRPLIKKTKRLIK